MVMTKADSGSLWKLEKTMIKTGGLRHNPVCKQRCRAAQPSEETDPFALWMSKGNTKR